MTQAYSSSTRRLVNRLQRGTYFSLSTVALALFLLASPEIARAKNTQDNKHAPSSSSTKKKGVSKVTHQRSTSEETRAERDRRMYRECKGLHNAGACRGYTR